MKKITKAENKAIIAEFADDIADARLTKQEVVDLSLAIDGRTYEEARLYAFCELNSWVYPDDCNTVEEFQAILEKEC